MSRRLRYIPPGGAMVEVTARTIQGRLLLRPSPALTVITLGILARAARLFSVAVHAHAFLSNHFHMLLSVVDAPQLASFMEYFNSNLAREAGRLAEWREKFWGRRYQAILVSEEEGAQVGRLAYLLAHGVKEGLVASPLDWPGVHCARALVEGTPVSGLWRNRTLESKARRKSLPLDPESFLEREELTLAPLPCWQHLDAAARCERVRALIEEIEASAREAEEESGNAPLGVEKVLRQHPHQQPNRLRKSPAPLIHAVTPEVRRTLRRSYGRFVEAFRRAALSLRSGILDVEFPAGAFPPARPACVVMRSG